MKKRVIVKVHGVVQGVNFRYHTCERARELGINGWVANTNDDCVECVAEGDEEKVDEFLAWLHRGPTSAMVKKVDVRKEKPIGEKHFDIRR